jgi:hypothetical protein
MWEGPFNFAKFSSIRHGNQLIDSFGNGLPSFMLSGPGEGFGRPVGDGKMRGGTGGGRVAHHGGPTDHRDDFPDRFHQEPSEFSSQRSDRFHYKHWDSNPEHVPKGRAYFEVSEDS